MGLEGIASPESLPDLQATVHENGQVLRVVRVDDGPVVWRIEEVSPRRELVLAPKKENHEPPLHLSNTMRSTATPCDFNTLRNRLAKRDVELITPVANLRFW